KYEGAYPDEIQHRWERAAEATYLLDDGMSEIKDEIPEAQKYYTQKRSKKHENE
ncbi:GTP pyrophosphokinase, partial [Staphylococcus aureus]